MLIYLNRKLYKKIQVKKEIQVNNVDETLQYNTLKLYINKVWYSFA